MNNKVFNTGHYLMGCRLDNWLRLLKLNDFSIEKSRIPQALLITATSVAMSPFAAAEQLLYRRKINAVKLEKDPIFVIGHWRSGTTYLQNMLAQDRQFGWFDPISTVTQPYSLVAGPLVKKSVMAGIADGRPMDNMNYAMDLPMEETYALLSINPWSIINLVTFPEKWKQYLPGAFLEDLPVEELRKWERDYFYLLKKQTYVNKGKQLILKSPDNTAHVKQLYGMYPNAKFINIHRDPYTTIRSTINMFYLWTQPLHLTAMPEDLEGIIEDTVVAIFKRMYEELFSIQGFFPASQMIDVPYKEFCADPVGGLEKIYQQLELGGFDEARPAFEAYAAGQKNYVKNKFDYPPELIRKINSQLGFYFDHYGYEKREAEE